MCILTKMSAEINDEAGLVLRIRSPAGSTIVDLYTLRQCVDGILLYSMPAFMLPPVPLGDMAARRVQDMTYFFKLYPGVFRELPLQIVLGADSQEDATTWQGRCSVTAADGTHTEVEVLDVGSEPKEVDAH